jgi:hypothetical protein
MSWASYIVRDKERLKDRQSNQTVNYDSSATQKPSEKLFL